MAEATPASDIRFAQFAVKMKFVSPDQVSEGIKLQRRYIRRDGQNFPSLARIMVAKSFLAKHQAKAVLDQVKHYEMDQQTANAGAEETNVLTPEQAELLSGIGEEEAVGAAPAAPAAVPPSAETGGAETGQVSGYRILETVGTGSMGTVYKAHQESMDRIVALKVLPPAMTANRRFVEQFLSEARAAGRLNHPNVIRVHDVGREKNVYFYSMEFVKGRSLDALMQSEPDMSVDRVLHIMTQVAQALDYGHKQGIVHRELRPEAIMVGADDQTKLADLGLTKVGSKRFLIGNNASYVAPEQASGGWTDIRTDLYSLGATFYHVVTGKLLFEGATPKEVLKLQIAGAVPDPTESNADLPRPVADILMKLLEKSPDARFQTPMELIDETKKLIKKGGKPKGEGRKSTRDSGRRSSGRLSARRSRSGRRSRRRRRR